MVVCCPMLSHPRHRTTAAKTTASTASSTPPAPAACRTQLWGLSGGKAPPKRLCQVRSCSTPIPSRNPLGPIPNHHLCATRRTVSCHSSHRPDTVWAARGLRPRIRDRVKGSAKAATATAVTPPATRRRTERDSPACVSVPTAGAGFLTRAAASTKARGTTATSAPRDADKTTTAAAATLPAMHHRSRAVIAAPARGPRRRTPIAPSSLALPRSEPGRATSDASGRSPAVSRIASMAMTTAATVSHRRHQGTAARRRPGPSSQAPAAADAA